MPIMTKEELTAHIRETVIPLVKDTVGASIADVVSAQVQKLAEERTPPAWAKQLFGGSQSNQAARDKGVGFGRIVRAFAFARQQGTGAEGAIKNLQAWGDADLADQVRERALGAASSPAGGYLVPVQQAAEVIELRRAATVVRALGPRVLPLPTGTMQIPKITAGASGSYIGENTNATKSQQTFGNVLLTAKKLAVLVPISNDLIRNSSPQADMVVRDDVVRSLAVTEDAAFIRADGTNGQPKGLRYWAPAGNIVASAGTSLTNMTADLGNAMLALMNANTPAGNWAWIFSPRSWKALTTIQNTNGFYVFRDEMVQAKTLWGFPFRVTTSVPITLTVGANSDCSEVYLANFDDLAIGDNLQLSIDVSQEAAYYDGSGVVAAFSQDQTVIRAIAEHDFVARYADAISVITGVRWS